MGEARGPGGLVGEPGAPGRAAPAGWSGGAIDPAAFATRLPPNEEPSLGQRVLQLTVLWGQAVLDTWEAKGPRVTAGGARSDVTVPLPWAGAPFTLAEIQDGTATILVPLDAEVAVRDGKGLIDHDPPLSPMPAPFPAGGYRLRLHDRLVFRVGRVSLVAQYVRGDARLPRAKRGFDRRFLSVWLAAAAVHLLLAALLLARPHTEPSALELLQRYASEQALRPPAPDEDELELDEE